MKFNLSQVSRERLPFLAGAIFLITIAAFFKIAWLTGVFAVLAVFTFWFFRDPERTAPEGPGLVISPADGRIIEISEARENRFIKDKTVKISIFLNIFNVHVNRIPSSGRIRGIYYQPGKFLAANKDLASTENEQNAVFLETPEGAKIVFVQVAGLVARRIVCWVREGAAVERGARFGMIRFGSRMDIFLPIGTEIKVALGDPVKGSETILGVLK